MIPEPPGISDETMSETATANPPAGEERFAPGEKFLLTVTFMGEPDRTDVREFQSDLTVREARVVNERLRSAGHLPLYVHWQDVSVTANKRTRPRSVMAVFSGLFA